MFTYKKSRFRGWRDDRHEREEDLTFEEWRSIFFSRIADLSILTLYDELATVKALAANASHGHRSENIQLRPFVRGADQKRIPFSIQQIPIFARDPFLVAS